MGKFIGFALAGTLASIVISADAPAAVVMTINQVGLDVVATSTGTLSLTGLTVDGTFSGAPPQLGANFGVLLTGNTGAGTYYGGFSGPGSFGSSGSVIATGGLGNTFGIVGVSGQVFLSTGFQSGSPVASSATFANQTLASLMLVSGTYTYTSVGDTIALNIGFAAPGVPEPATWAMIVLGMGGIGTALRRRTTLAPRIRLS
jgi:hypothetical protein